MKNTKRMLSFILSVMMILAMVPAVMAADVAPEETHAVLTFYNSDGEEVLGTAILLAADETLAEEDFPSVTVEEGYELKGWSLTPGGEAIEFCYDNLFEDEVEYTFYVKFNSTTGKAYTISEHKLYAVIGEKSVIPETQTVGVIFNNPDSGTDYMKFTTVPVGATEVDPAVVDTLFEKVKAEHLDILANYEISPDADYSITDADEVIIALVASDAGEDEEKAPVIDITFVTAENSTSTCTGVSPENNWIEPAYDIPSAGEGYVWGFEDGTVYEGDYTYESFDELGRIPADPNFGDRYVVYLYAVVDPNAEPEIPEEPDIPEFTMPIDVTVKFMDNDAQVGDDIVVTCEVDPFDLGSIDPMDVFDVLPAGYNLVEAEDNGVIKAIYDDLGKIAGYEATFAVEKLISEVISVTFQETTTTYKWFNKPVKDEKIFGEYVLKAGMSLITPEASPAEHFVLDAWKLSGTEDLIDIDNENGATSTEISFDELKNFVPVEVEEVLDEATGVFVVTYKLVFEPVYKQVTKTLYITFTNLYNPFKTTIAKVVLDVDDCMINLSEIEAEGVLPEGCVTIYETNDSWNGDFPILKTSATTATLVVYVVDEVAVDGPSYDVVG